MINLDKIHEASMQILDTTGIRISHPKAIELFKRNGCRIAGDLVFLSEDIVMHWIHKAPREFMLYARNPKHDMKLGGDRIEFAPGYGAPLVIGPSGEARYARLADYVRFMQLVQASDLFNINGGILVQPNDIEAAKSFPVMLYRTMLGSDKCLMAGTGGETESRIVLDMLEILFGDREHLIEKPRIIALINTTSPLMIDRDSLDTLFHFVEHGQPVIIAPATMAGTTGPVTLAGTIALANAEALAGIVLTQMIREGAPVLYGFQADTADMKTGCIGRGSPEGALCFAHGARLGKYYGIPCRGGGTATSAKSISAQSGYEGMMQMMSTCQEKMNLIIHTAGMMDADAAMSFEQFVVDLEITGMIRRYLDDIDVTDETLALDVINQVGPGGEFLTHRHTSHNFRRSTWFPEISIRGALNNISPNEKLEFNIEKKLNTLLNQYQQPDFSSDVNKSLKKVLQSIDIYPDIDCN